MLSRTVFIAMIAFIGIAMIYLNCYLAEIWNVNANWWQKSTFALSLVGNFAIPFGLAIYLSETWEKRKQ